MQLRYFIAGGPVDARGGFQLSSASLICIGFVAGMLSSMHNCPNPDCHVDMKTALN